MACLLRLLQDLYDLVKYRESVAIDDRNEEARILLHCDNSACVSWANNVDSSSLIASSKALERRALSRLVGSLHEELLALRRLATLKIVHLAGSSHGIADGLSRTFDRNVNDSIMSLADSLCQGAVREQSKQSSPQFASEQFASSRGIPAIAWVMGFHRLLGQTPTTRLHQDGTR